MPSTQEQVEALFAKKDAIEAEIDALWQVHKVKCPTCRCMLWPWGVDKCQCCAGRRFDEKYMSDPDPDI